jgi:hypothetical protein
LADHREWLTPYNFAQNNPINRIDPDGALDEPLYKKAWNYVSNFFKGVDQSQNQQHTIYKMRDNTGGTTTSGGDTKFGIQDNSLGRIKNGKPVGAPVVRFDAADGKTTTPHINGPKGTNFHIPLAGGEKTLNALEATGKTLDAIGKVAKPVAIATDVVRMGDAINADGGTVGINTVRTGASVAGGWAGAWAGAGAGAFLGAKIGLLGGPFAEITVPIGGFVGGIAGGIGGAFAGSSGAEKIVDTVTEKK